MTQFASTPSAPPIGLWARAVMFAALFAGIYYSTYHWLLTYDWMREDYNSGFLVPLIVGYLIYEKRDTLAAVPSMPSWGGVGLAAFGMLLFWLGELAGEYFTLYLSSWLVIVGLCWLTMGWKKINIIAFPLCFILAMFPLPNFIHGKVSFQLKLLSSQLGVSVIQAYGMSAFREGNIIDLGFTRLQVVDACSGLRYLVPLIMLGLIIAYFFKAALWKRILLVLSTIPISVLVNGLRIASVGILYRFWGPAVAEGFFHDFSGWFIFMISLAILLAEMWLLGKIGRRLKRTGKSPAGIPDEADCGKERSGDSNSTQSNGSGAFYVKLLSPQVVVAAAILVTSLVAAHAIEFRERVPVSKRFDIFPSVVGQWEGTPSLLEPDIIASLDLTDYVIRNFRGPGGKTVNFYTAYYESQSKGESIHTPATCLPGGGWAFRSDGAVTVPVPWGGEKQMTVNRAIMSKGSTRQLAYFWFPARDRVLTSAYQMKIYNFWDALTRQRTDGALVRVITPVYESENVADAEKRLQSFLQLVNPILETFLPK